MITLVEALNYRCLRYISQPLGPFHVLVGANASGKSTFLDVISFLSKLVSEGPDAAVGERTTDFRDLVWGRKGGYFELAIEARIPESRKELMKSGNFDTVRYEIAMGLDEAANEVGIVAERVLLKTSVQSPAGVKDLFPVSYESPGTLLSGQAPKNMKSIVKKGEGNDWFYSEVPHEIWDGLIPSFSFGPRRSTLANLPEDQSMFPVSMWLKELLTQGVQQIVLNSALMRKASPPGQGRGFKPDGSNLPWVIDTLEKKYEGNFKSWIAHLQTALPDLESIRTVERPEDKHRYLMIGYKGGLEIPSWVASDGTLRLLALTLPAYLPDFKGIYLIEEPENGIHPLAIETMIQSLTSVYDAQILLATHSPVILGLVEASKVLCFAKTTEGATDIVTGDRHPALKEWKGEVNLGVLFAGGVLG